MDSKKVWEEFEKKVGAERRAKEEVKREFSKNMDIITACDHRLHDGFYSIKCTHPDRPGKYKYCVNFSCPVLF